MFRRPRRARFSRGDVFRPIVESLEDRIVPSAIRMNPAFTANVLDRNDDGSTGAVDMGFTINLYGLVTHQCFVNNNGNITFDAPLSAYTPDDLTTPGNPPIIAPFFADVDTRNPESGVVTYGQDIIDGHLVFGVNYFNVGYYFEHADKLNTFQLVLISCGDGNFIIEFNYQQLLWETGDASGGVDGFGGFSAHAGFTNGTGIEGTFHELPGSGVHGAFLDSNPTGLVHVSFNSDVIGRQRFLVRDGSFIINPAPPIEPLFVTGAASGLPLVQVYHPATMNLEYSFLAYESTFLGGVRVAVGDVNGDGYADIVTGAGYGAPGGHVRVFDGLSGAEIASFLPYAPGMRSGVYVAVGDVNGDGYGDIIVAPDAGAPPNLRVFSGLTGEMIYSFYAFQQGFVGGVRVTSIDLNMDGYAEIIVGAGPGSNPHVRTFNGRTLEQYQGLIGSFLVYDPEFRGGVQVAAGLFGQDICGPIPGIVTAPGYGAYSHIRAFDVHGHMTVNVIVPPGGTIFGADGLVPFTTTHLAIVDRNGDGRADIVTALGQGGLSLVSTFNPFQNMRLLDSFYAYQQTNRDGVFVGGVMG